MQAETSSDQRPVIQASEILAKIERGEDVEYDGVVIEGDLDISGLQLPTEHVERTEFELALIGSDELKVISSPISIINSEIRGEIFLINAHFKRSIFLKAKFTGSFIAFGGSLFSEEANFEGAEFGYHAKFSGAKFTGRVSFIEAMFSNGADFAGAEFGAHANFMNAKFMRSFGEISYFMGSKFRDGVYFRKSKFRSEVDFGGAMAGNVCIGGAEFSVYADFREAEFGYHANFHGAKFGGYAYFDYGQFSKEVSFNGAKFERPESQEVACRIAKRNMENQGNKKAADDYFYREMEAIRLGSGIKGTDKIVWPWKMQISEWLKLVGSKVWRLGRYDILEYVFIQGIFGYGVHPLRLFVFWILMAFAFASFYWYFNAVESARTWADYIWFSIATSATPGYALYNPIGNYKIVTGIQAIIGTFMWAAFIATFARKWQH